MRESISIPEGALETLQARGWALVHSDFREEAELASRTLRIAESLGTPVRGRATQTVEVLTPKAPEAAHPASLSRKYGLDAFPFHVDTAHWTVPARYMVLSCVSPGEEVVPTLLVNRDHLHLSDEEQAIAKSAVFLVKNGRNSFYSSILGDARGFVRYDPGCMEPLSQDSAHALRLFSHERVAPHIQKVAWEPGDSLIIDNWQMLHARAAANKNASRRLLLRCLVS